jgi:hypothetical protein
VIQKNSDTPQKQRHRYKYVSTKFIMVCSRVGYIDERSWRGWTQIWKSKKTNMYKYCSYLTKLKQCETVNWCVLMGTIFNSSDTKTKLMQPCMFTAGTCRATEGEICDLKTVTCAKMFSKTQTIGQEQNLSLILCNLRSYYKVKNTK